MARLLEAAETLFADRGFHGASIHEICARADVGIGTFYAHFDNKFELIQRVMKERQVTIAQLVTPDDLTTPAKLEAKLAKTVEDPISAGMWRAWHQAVQDNDEMRDFHARWRRASRDELAETIAKARAAAAVRIDEPTDAVVAWALMTLARDLAINEHVVAPDLATIARLTVDLVFGTVVRAPRDASVRPSRSRRVSPISGSATRRP